MIAASAPENGSEPREIVEEPSSESWEIIEEPSSGSYVGNLVRPDGSYVQKIHGISFAQNEKIVKGGRDARMGKAAVSVSVSGSTSMDVVHLE